MKRVGVREIEKLFDARGNEAWLELVFRHGKTFRVQQLVVTCDTRLVEQLMRDPAHTQRRPSAYRWLTRFTPGSDGLIFLDGPRYDVQRHAVAPTVTREHVDQQAEVIHAAALKWAQSCQGDADLESAMIQLGASIVLETSFGLDPSQPLAREFAQELIGHKQWALPRDPRRRLDVLGLRARLLLAIPWLCANFVNLHQRVARMQRLVPRLQDERVRCPMRNANWLDGLAAAQLPVPELTNALSHLYGAYNTVDFMIASALFELSRHPDWRARIRSELAAVIGARPYPTTKDVPHLPLLWGAIKETLRLYPVSMGIIRHTGKPLEVDGERIPTGTQVMVLPYALHRHPEYWDEPQAFRPDRWSTSKRVHPPFAYIPFLIGPRKCMGQLQAQLELLVRVSTIVRAADVDVDADTAPMTQFLVPRFAKDLPFRVTRLDPEKVAA
jgi:cytochrome P450